MKPYYEKELEVSKLRMDENNPRHPNLESQRDIIEWMTSGEKNIGDKLYNLARDIVEFGLNPSERISVLQSEESDQEYIVLEGNRRLTAIKLLNNPDIAPNEGWKARFKKLRGEDYTSIKKVPSIIYTELDTAFHFIELKHLGESNGAGTVPWGPQQKARHEKRSRRKSRQYKALQLLDYIQNHKNIDEDIKALAGAKFPLTTLDRLLSDVEFREFLGLGLSEDGDIQFSIDPEEALKAIIKVIQDFGSGKKKVGHVINKEKRGEYKHSFKKDSLPDHSKSLNAPISVDVELTENKTNTTSGSQSQKGQRGTTYQDPRNRRFLVISGTHLPINPKNHNRAKRIFEEMRRIPLKDKLGKQMFSNAGILLLRLFHEISVHSYIDAHKITHPAPTGWKQISLTEKTRAVLKDIEAKTLLTSQEIKVVNKALSEPSKISNPNSLNDFAHNLNQVPNPNDLIDIWDTYIKFYSALWSTLT